MCCFSAFNFRQHCKMQTNEKLFKVFDLLDGTDGLLTCHEITNISRRASDDIVCCCLKPLDLRLEEVGQWVVRPEEVLQGLEGCRREVHQSDQALQRPV